MYMVASSNHSSFLVPLDHLSSSQPVYVLLSASQFRTLGVPLLKDPLGRSASRRSTFGPRLLPRDRIVSSPLIIIECAAELGRGIKLDT